MAIFDLFSKRQRRLRGEVPDVYTYDQVPDQLRVQLVHVFRDLLGQPQHPYYQSTHEKPAETYKLIVDVLCREYGRLALGDNQYVDRDYSIELLNFFLKTTNAEQALDVIELCAKVADRITRNWEYLHESDPSRRVDAGVEEINGRLREHGVGFQIEDGELVRVDSDLLHSEAVKPALSLLRTKDFAGPRDEFLGAYEHYRKGNFEEALTEALKAFESTMKAICDQKKWSYDAGATAKKLVNVCLSNGLVDPFWESHFAGLRATLENGIATVRNKLGGHGQGSKQREVPREVVAYALHLTAATIVLLIESSRR